MISQQDEDGALGLASVSAQSKVMKAQCEPKLPTAETLTAMILAHARACLLTAACTSAQSFSERPTCLALQSGGAQSSPCNFPLSQEVK
jgi:hypothetical protein